MIAPEHSVASSSARRQFAAKYSRPALKRVVLIANALLVIIALGSFLNSDSAAAGEALQTRALVIGSISAVLALAGAVLSIYLWRGRGETPSARARREERERFEAEQAERRASEAADDLRTATSLLAASGGGAAVVAYRELEAKARHWHGDGYAEPLSAALNSIDFDVARLQSPRYGYVYTLDRQRSLELFRDWIILGRESYQVDKSTQGFVHVDGSIQISNGYDPNGRLVEQRHDGRRAEVQLLGNGWSVSVPISPDDAIEARKLVAQVMSHVDTLKPRGATSDDIAAMVNRILNNSGQPPAEKLKQLSNLRFERLLSDEEYERAKEKILRFD